MCVTRTVTLHVSQVHAAAGAAAGCWCLVPALCGRYHLCPHGFCHLKGNVQLYWLDDSYSAMKLFAKYSNLCDHGT